MLDKLTRSALSVTHALWAASLLLEPWRYAGKPVIPTLFAIIHIVAALLILSRYRVYGGWLSVALLAYYWVRVKPREPIAEPQSVGILVISAVLLMPHAQRLFKNKLPPNAAQLAFRLGLAYPFLEWGLDALRNPLRFQSYLRSNSLTAPIVSAWSAEQAVLVLGFFELAVAFLLAFGLLSRLVSFVSLLALVTFSVAAGYPLALPQDIVLGAAAVFLVRTGAGVFSVDHAFRKLFSTSA